MLHKDKVIAMTKIAIYEKNQVKKDEAFVRRFQWDFTSTEGFITRLYVTFALLIIFALDFAGEVYANMTNITNYDFIGKGVSYLTIWILVMAVYSFVMSRVYRSRYQEAMERINDYKKRLRALDRL